MSDTPKIGLTTLEESQGTAEILLKLDYLIEKCKAGRLHQIIILSDADQDGHRMSTLLCMDDAHALAFLDRSISALQQMLERDFDRAIDSEVH